MKIDFLSLVDCLTINMAYKNGEVMKRLKFQVNRKTGNFGFAKEVLPNCIVVEDWIKYYKFDAAADYENPSVFVADCLIEEVMNKIELEEAFEETINELIEKHRK